MSLASSCFAPRVAAMAPGPTNNPTPAVRWGRRRLLKFGLGAGAGLLLPALLAACRRGEGPVVLAAKGAMPLPWLEALPAGWSQVLLEGSAAVLEALEPAQVNRRPGLALASLPDGWASELPLERLQPFAEPRLIERLAAAAQPVSRLYRPEGQPVLAFPWAFSPWVMVFRRQPELAERARGAEGWAVLADPALKKQLVLPSSPRLSIELCSGDLAKLQVLRAQARAFDDVNALNLLLTGEAAAAVVPLQRLIPLLRRDQRLEVVLPAGGAPLTWQLLLRPAAAKAAPPLEWLGAVLEPSLLVKLLAGGWVPPLPRRELEPALARLPRTLSRLLLPPDAVLQRCWSLPPLSPERRLALQILWDAAAPG